MVAICGGGCVVVFALVRTLLEVVEEVFFSSVEAMMDE